MTSIKTLTQFECNFTQILTVLGSTEIAKKKLLSSNNMTAGLKNGKLF